MPWEKKYDEDEAIEKAMRAFWARGYEGTSVSDLVRATGVNRGSLYAAFPDKRALFMESLRRYDRRHRADFLRHIAARHAPKDAIVAVFECAASPPDDAPAGCLVVNTALEVAPHDADVRGFVKASLGRVEEFFREMIEAAQEERAAPETIDPRTAAQALLGLFLGMRVLARAGGDRAALDAITSQARWMLD